MTCLHLLAFPTVSGCLNYDGWEGHFVSLRSFADTLGLLRVSFVRLSLLTCKNKIFRQEFRCISVQFNAVTRLNCPKQGGGGGINPGRHFARATKFCTVAPDIYGCVASGT
jgi:hypothetical protein